MRELPCFERLRNVETSTFSSHFFVCQEKQFIAAVSEVKNVHTTHMGFYSLQDKDEFNNLRKKLSEINTNQSTKCCYMF